MIHLLAVMALHGPVEPFPPAPGPDPVVTVLLDPPAPTSGCLLITSGQTLCPEVR